MRRFVVVTLVAMALLVPMICQGRTSEMGRWTRMPTPGNPGWVQYVGGVAVEPDGTPWIIASGEVFYWDGKQWKKPVGDALHTGYVCEKLLGGTDRPVYVTQYQPDDDRRGRLYKLSKGKATRVASLYIDDFNESAGVYVTKSGMVINWAAHYLGALVSGRWEDAEGGLDSWSSPFEIDGRVCLVSGRDVYTVDSKGAFSHTTMKLSDSSGIDYGAARVLPWGTDRLLYNYRYAYNIKTGEPVETSEVRQGFVSSEIYGAVCCAQAGPGGSLYFATVCNRAYHLVRVDMEGAYTELAPAAGDKADLRLGEPMGPMLVAGKDIWFGLRSDGIVRMSGNTIRTYDWRDGLNTGDIRWLAKGTGGKIYAASGESIYVFDPNLAPIPQPAAKLWQSYRLRQDFILQDFSGRIWMLLENHPGEISRWDGREWLHIKMPADIWHIGAAIIDDTGHILAGSDGDTDSLKMDISADSARPVTSLHKALSDAFARGATRFDTYRFPYGCALLPEGHVLIGEGSGLTYWDRVGASTFRGFERRASSIVVYESAKYGALVCGERDDRPVNPRRYSYFRDGRLVDIDYQFTPGSRWLISHTGIQPFEEELLRRHPGRYLPVEYLKNEGVNTENSYRILFNCSAGTGKPDYVCGDELYHCAQVLSTPTGAFWMGNSKLLGGRRMIFDCLDTPLECVGVGCISQVREDPAGNIWVMTGERVMMKNLTSFKLSCSPLPARAGATLQVEAKPVLPGLDSTKLRLFWRLNGGGWQGSGKPGGVETITFPSAGSYKLEIVGLDDVGGTSQISTYTVESSGAKLQKK